VEVAVENSFFVSHLSPLVVATDSLVETSEAVGFTLTVAIPKNMVLLVAVNV